MTFALEAAALDAERSNSLPHGFLAPSAGGALHQAALKGHFLLRRPLANEPFLRADQTPMP